MLCRSTATTLPLCALVCCTEPPGEALPTSASVSMPTSNRSDTPLGGGSRGAGPTEAQSADGGLAATAIPTLGALPEDLRPWVEGIAVTGRGIGRRALVSWTTAAQAAALRDGGPLLVRETSPAFGPAAFDYRIDADAAEGDEIAKLLLRGAFARKRFAWPAAFATLRGGGGGPYGDVLLSVRLREDAFVLDYTARRLYGTQGDAIPIAELTAAPQRLGAVYWDAGRFREYVLVNEAAIEHVASGTPEVIERLREERRRLDQLAALLTRTPDAARAPLLDALTPATAFGPMKLADVVELAGSLARAAKTGPVIDRALSASFTLGEPRAPRAIPCAMRREVPNDVTHGYGTFEVCSPANLCAVAEGKCQLVQRSTIVLTGDR